MSWSTPVNRATREQTAKIVDGIRKSGAIKRADVRVSEYARFHSGKMFMGEKLEFWEVQIAHKVVSVNTQEGKNKARFGAQKREQEKLHNFLVMRLGDLPGNHEHLDQIEWAEFTRIGPQDLDWRGNLEASLKAELDTLCNFFLYGKSPQPVDKSGHKRFRGMADSMLKSPKTGEGRLHMAYDQCRYEYRHSAYGLRIRFGVKTPTLIRLQYATSIEHAKDILAQHDLEQSMESDR